MSYLETGYLIGIVIGHASAFALGLWRGIRERAGV